MLYLSEVDVKCKDAVYRVAVDTHPYYASQFVRNAMRVILPFKNFRILSMRRATYQEIDGMQSIDSCYHAWYSYAPNRRLK